MLKIITATTLAIAFLIVVMPTNVQAVTAEQNQEVKVECNTTAGAYGQNSTANCKSVVSQSQKLIRLRKGVKPTGVKATGLDTPVAVVSTLTLAGGAVATFLRIKNQA